MSYSTLSYEASDNGIATITVNRPHKLNALSAEVMGEFESALTRVESSPEVRALIVTGGGEKAFVAGADIAEIGKADPMGAAELAMNGQKLFRRLELMPKPSVAAIGGYALGGGLELAMACTLRVASENALLGQPEVKLGIIAGYGGTQRLPRLVGRGSALRLLLTGESIDAREALRIGLVDFVVKREELLEFARGLLMKMIANAPRALALTIRAVDTGLSCGIEEGLRFEAAAFGLAASTVDCKEGIQAFLQKRSPTFTGR